MSLRSSRVDRRIALVVLVVAAGTAAPSSFQRSAPESRFALEELTITQLQQQMTSGAATSRSLVEQYLARIDALDRRGPALRSIVELNPDALAFADRMDAERKAGRVRGPLHGIPIVIKD